MKGFIGLAMLCLRAAASAAEVADYRFDGNFQSSIAGAPDLVELAPFGGVFAHERALDRNAWLFPQGVGLALDTSGLLSNAEYSIAMQVRVSETDPYLKLIDTSGLTLDTGFYVIGEDIGFYDEAFGDIDGPLQPNLYYLVVVTRAADGTCVGYIDGDERFRFQDTEGQALIPADGLLHFLRDDEVTANGENSDGAIARLRLFDTALGPADVAALGSGERNFRDGFEG
jgi:hypothetical protein